MYFLLEDRPTTEMHVDALGSDRMTRTSFLCKLEGIGSFLNGRGEHEHRSTRIISTHHRFSSITTSSTSQSSPQLTTEQAPPSHPSIMSTVFSCRPCDRDFFTSGALGQHRKFSTYHEQCWRCRRNFESWQAFQQHIAASAYHWLCSICDHDASNATLLKEHRREAHGLHGCERCQAEFHEEWDLGEHERTQHHKCLYCDHFFDSHSNLTAVSQSLQPATSMADHQR